VMGLMEEHSSVRGNIEAIDRIAALGLSHHVPGHGGTGGVEIAGAYREFLDRLRRRVGELFDEGLESYEMKAQVAASLPEFRDWQDFDLRLGSYIGRAFAEAEEASFR